MFSHPEAFMTRIPLATILAALVFAPLLTADDAKSGEVKSKRADAAKEFAAFTKKAQEFQTKMANATPEERKELLKDRPNPQPLLEKAQKMIDDDGTDDAAVDALVLLAQFSPQFGAKHFELLTEHHATSSKIGRVCMRAMARDGLSPEGEKFITTVLAKNK